LFHELAKAEADILQKCFHKPREVLHMRCSPGTLWIQKIREAVKVSSGNHGTRKRIVTYELFLGFLPFR
jgi:hypothetical protein